MTSSIFDGSLSIASNVSTKKATPIFNLNLGAENFDISQSFKTLELLRNLAPIAKILEEKLNTNLNLSGNLDQDFLPDLSSISGGALVELLATNINKNQDGFISALEGSFSFIDFNKLYLKS